MKKITIFLLFAATLYANDTLLKFYKATLSHLQYDSKQINLKESEKHAHRALNWQRFGNFSLDTAYTRTKAKQLANSFETTDVSLSDTIDLFGRQSYKFESIALQYEEQKTLLEKQKEELFISLVSMISTYQQTKEILLLHQELLNKQQNLLDKLNSVQNSISKMNIIQLQNSITLLHIQVLDEQNELTNMQLQLDNYSASTPIPKLQEEKEKFDETAFVNLDTDARLNAIASRRLLNEACGVKENFLPRLGAAVTYQSINDPTANGDNYSFSISLSMPLDASTYEQNEALRAEALSLKSNTAVLKVKRQNEYIRQVQNIKNVKEQLTLLESNLQSYKKSEETMEKAFLKQYVDFNTYMQTFSQMLDLLEKIITLKNEKNRHTAILNALSKGTIYE